MNNKRFIFVSDFDGTLTAKDFYQMIIDDYIGEVGQELYKAWRRKEYKDKDFLAQIYRSIGRDEDEILEDILKIEWDEHASEVIQKIKDSGGEFAILSAGTSYYIDRLLEAKKISDLKVYSNPGYYQDRGIHLKPDESSPYYSDVYGIDKAKVVKAFKEQYEKVYFAGDSAPDIEPAKLADLVFAKGTLQEMLREQDIPFIPINHFGEVEDELIRRGVLRA